MDYLVVDFEFTFYKKPIGRPRTFFSEIIEIGWAYKSFIKAREERILSRITKKDKLH
mgnify:CR=1 FL=1